MADETETKPPEAFAETFNRTLNERLADDPEVRVVSGMRPATAAERLFAFEVQHFGADAVRIREQIEKGSGSPIQLAKPEVRAQHAALEKLIEAEAKLAAAHTALIQADTDYEAALAATEPKPDAPSE